MVERQQRLIEWLEGQLGRSDFEITPASTDASFRRYFRIRYDGVSQIVMDAPPDRESLEPFVSLARQFHSIGLNVPEPLAEERREGFLLLSDLGSRHYLDALNEQNVERLYGDALGALAILQAVGPEQEGLPPYDQRLLLQEMELFRHWLLQRHLKLELSDAEQGELDTLFERLAQSALAQPQVAVHRDYHSRNLMVCKHNPGILDFQDAVHGAFTYDLVSLLRDCYIEWPRKRVEEWALGYRRLALEHGIVRQVGEEQFIRWFDWMGVQRHLKASGIFARLYHRDGKAGYLGDIPRTVGYISEVSACYSELQGLERLCAERLVPSLERAMEREDEE